MLYIHKLSDLNPKSADIESVPFVRGMNLSGSFPFSSQKIAMLFADCIVSEGDLSSIQNSLQLLEPTLAKLNDIAARGDPVYEPVNVGRAVQSLKSLVLPLANNLQYGRESVALQQGFMGRAAALLNTIPALRTTDEKSKLNAEISAYFEKVLRSKGFAFTHMDLVHEAQTSLVRDMAESFRKGYIFHVTLEEELRKATFADIKPRIPAGKLKESEEIEAAIRCIGEGVEQAYALNMKMLLWAVIFYSCIKLVMSR